MTTQTLKNWNNFRIKDFAKIKGGKRLPKGEFVQDEKTAHPYIRVTDMFSDRLDTSKIKYITDPQFEKIKRYIISSDDVYVSNAGTIGLVGKVPKWLSGANLTENALKITEMDKSKITQDFLMYFLRSHKGQEQIRARTGGSSQPKLALTRLADVVIHTPDIFTQKEITDILTSYDDLIYNNTSRIQILEQTAQAIYAEWFVNFRFPGHEKVRMVDSGTDFGKIPEGWSIGKLSDLVNITMGQSPSSDFYNESGEGSPFHQGVTNFDFRFPTTTTFSTGGTRRASAGDILFSVRAPVGRINVADRNMIIGRGLSAMRSVSESQSYLLYNLKNHFATEDLIGGGAIYASVTRADLSNFPLVIPDAKIINLFEELVSPFDGLIFNISHNLSVLRCSRDLLLPKLVTGEIKIK